MPWRWGSTAMEMVLVIPDGTAHTKAGLCSRRSDRSSTALAATARTHLPWARIVVSLLVLGVCLGISPLCAHAQKTDLVTMNNGNTVLGEMRFLDRGLLELKTSAMGTVKVKWPKVVTVNTDKKFEVVLEDGTIYFGSLSATESDSVIVRDVHTTLTVPTGQIVRLQRLKDNFWSALDGHLQLGFGYTQQNNKVEFTTGGAIVYARHANLTKINVDTNFSRQDGTDDIFRLDGTLGHLRQFSGRWFYLGFINGQRNSQLSLDHRTTLGGGIGRMVVESNRLDLGIWIGPAYSREKFSGDPTAGSWPLIFSADFLFFVWGSLDTNFYSQFMLLPILGEEGRWRLNWDLQAEKELLASFYLIIDLTERYDSDPPSVGANNNDFSTTVALKFTF